MTQLAGSKVCDAKLRILHRVQEQAMHEYCWRCTDTGRVQVKVEFYMESMCPGNAAFLVRLCLYMAYNIYISPLPPPHAQW